MTSKKAFLLFIPLLLSGCSSSIKVQSSHNENIKVDGSYEEWGTSLRAVEGKNISCGFASDKDFLYLSLVTSDRSAVRKIIMNGLTVWIGSSEGKIGIKYPFRPDPSEMNAIRNRRTPGEQRDDQSMMNNMLKDRGDLQVVNEDEFPLYTVSAVAGKDFRGAIRVDNSTLVYEMRIPIRNNDISGRVFASGITNIEIKFLTGEFNREAGMRGTPPGQRSPGERLGMGGNRRGGMQPRMEGMDFSPIELSFDVVITR